MPEPASTHRSGCHLLLGAVAAYYMVQYSYGDVAPTVVWVTGALVPFTLLATLPLSGIVRRVNQASRASGAATTNAMEESIDNIAAVQSLGGMDVESERFKARSAESFRRHRHVIFFEYFALAFSIFATVVGYFVIAMVVTEDVIAGRMSAGDWAGLFVIFSTLSATAIDLGLSWLKLQGNVAAVRRVFFFIDYATEDEAALKPDLPRLQDTVTVDHVDFTYPDGRRALEDVTLELHTGEMIAIVGPTGAGKTSLAYLLPRFLVPSAGRVLFDLTIDAANGPKRRCFMIVLCFVTMPSSLVSAPDRFRAQEVLQDEAWKMPVTCDWRLV